VPAHAHAAVAAWRQAKGFDWVDDTTSYGTHRWGWVTEHIGDSIDLKVRQATSVCMRMILGISLLHALLGSPVWAQHSLWGHIPHARLWRPCQLCLIYVPRSSFTRCRHVGKPFVVQVNLTVPGHPDNSRVHLKVAILKSYNRMGMLRVVRPMSCINHCCMSGNHLNQQQTLSLC